MITVNLARRLHEAGLTWSPLPGDRFIVRFADMEDDVFHLADMTVEVLHGFVGGPVVGFNGVAEWALDSVALQDTLWLPREDQMRSVIGERFVRLERDDEGYVVVVVDIEGTTQRHPHQDAECAYAQALLQVLAT